MTTDDELAALVLYDGRKVMTMRELMEEKARTLLFYWQDQGLVTVNIATKEISKQYMTLSYRTVFTIGKATFVNDVLWSKVKGRGVRRAALEAEDGSVFTTRFLQAEGTGFELDYLEKWEMGLNPGDSIEYDAYDLGDLDQQILVRGDVNAALAFLDDQLEGYACPHRLATEDEITRHEQEIVDRKARWDARDTERRDTGWSDDRKTAFRKTLDAREAERALSEALANGETVQ